VAATLNRFAAAVGAGSVLRLSHARRFNRRGATDLARCVPRGFAVGAIEPTETDVLVGHAHALDGCDRVIVKLARTARGARSLRRECDMLTALHGDRRITGWEVPTPEIWSIGELDGLPYLVESALGGETIGRLLTRELPEEPLTARAMQAIEGLHRRTAQVVNVDTELLRRWIYSPVEAVGPIVAGSPRRAAAIRDLGRELAARLEGRTVAAGWIHGDFTPGNVLIDPHAGRITGVVDWELAGTPELPVIDRATFVLATYLETTGRQLGAVVAAIANDEASPSLRWSLGKAAQRDAAVLLDVRSVALLCWLRHVAALVTRSERKARDSAWTRHNVHQVLDTLARH
jgi:hypothetical protein